MTERKTKQQLVEELAQAQHRINELELALKGVQPELQSPHTSEITFRAMIESLPQCIFSKDAQGRFTYANPSYCKNEGKALEEFLGKDDFDMHPPEFAEKYRADDAKVMESGQLFSAVEEHQSLGGEKTLTQVMKIPVYDANGQNAGIIGIFWDITEQVHAEEDRIRLQQEVIDAQQRAIAELSTPVIPIMDRIIVLPMVGNIDSMRARDITRALLAGIGHHRAKVVILDVTGVSLMDTGIVNHLNKTIQAARLKGAQTIVTGISDAVAESIVDLGIDWSEITTLSDLQTGLLVALDSLGVRLTR
jgi:rsbT co-antagonist protein RsbR